LFAALIISVIVIGAVAIDFAFRSLLVDQARLQLRQVADQIEGLARDASQFGFAEDEAPLRIRLSDRATLDSWASANEYVQIDTTGGQVLGKSSNMGGLTFPPFHQPKTGSPLVFSVQQVNGNRAGTVLVLDTVLTDNDGRPLVIAQIGERLDIVDALIARARFILLVITLAAIVVIAAATYFIAGTAIDPIERLTAEVAEIGSERLDRRLRWTRRDELGRLAGAFDAMLDRLQSAFARERQFISDASHELRTPLTVINGNAQMLQRWGDRDPEILRSSLSAIADESGRLAGMVSGMLTLAKAESGDAIPKEPLVIERIVDDVVLHAREFATEKGLTLTSHHANGSGTIVIGDPGLLRQLVRNLVDNAIKFTTEGSIDVHVRRNGETAAIEVTDTGAGIDEGSADRLFDRFFRGDPAHARATEGTGLGLAIVRSIARVHGGTVRARPRPEGGSTFTVTLPIEPEFTPGS
jgi:signal transduction histidine kinase